jgi:hypothetical protein
MGITLLAAIGEGLAAGLIAGMLFQWVASWIPRVDLWQPAANLVRSLVAIREDDDFFARYGELLKLLGRYLLRQAIIASLPIAVVTCAFAFLPQLEKQSWAVARHFHREVAARAPVGTPARMSSWTAPLQTVELTSLVCVCVGSGIGMALLRKRT